MDPDSRQTRSRSRTRRDAGWFAGTEEGSVSADAGRHRRRRKRTRRTADAPELFEREDETKDLQEEFNLALVVLLAAGIVLALCLAYILKASDFAAPI